MRVRRGGGGGKVRKTRFWELERGWRRGPKGCRVAMEKSWEARASWEAERHRGTRKTGRVAGAEHYRCAQLAVGGLERRGARSLEED